MRAVLKQPQWHQFDEERDVRYRRLIEPWTHPIWLNSNIRRDLTNAACRLPGGEPVHGGQLVESGYEVMIDGYDAGIVWSFLAPRRGTEYQLFPEPGPTHWTCATVAMEVFGGSSPRRGRAIGILYKMHYDRLAAHRRKYAPVESPPELDELVL